MQKQAAELLFASKRCSLQSRPRDAEFPTRHHPITPPLMPEVQSGIIPITPREGESQKPSRQARADAVGGKQAATGYRCSPVQRSMRGVTHQSPGEAVRQRQGIGPEAGTVSPHRRAGGLVPLSCRLPLNGGSDGVCPGLGAMGMRSTAGSLSAAARQALSQGTKRPQHSARIKTRICCRKAGRGCYQRYSPRSMKFGSAGSMAAGWRWPISISSEAAESRRYLMPNWNARLPCAPMVSRV